MHLVKNSSIFIILAVFLNVTIATKPDRGKDSLKIKEAIESMQECVVDMSDSFGLERIYPATSPDQLTAACKRKSDAYKCIKEKVKTGVPGIIKRGLLSYVQGRQKYHKKYCSNVQSDASKNYIASMQCAQKHKATRFAELDQMLTNKMIAIERMNYNDSAVELKQICCALYLYKRDKNNSIGPECLAFKEKLEEQVTETVTDDLSLLCEDEDKLLNKICPSIEPLKLKNKPHGDSDKNSTLNSAGLVLYLVATLGDPVSR